ncbi:DUF4124 domain-containing protein [Luteimonas aestuarii]|nr:DUF4124 domain-containing protein [Luteimonas aestuarii]
MRLGWAIALGIVAGGLVVWWLGRSDPLATGTPDAAAGREPAASRPASAGTSLYRWRDDAGTLQLTDTPPTGRPYETVDVGTLERRNTFDPRDPPPAQ